MTWKYGSSPSHRGGGGAEVGVLGGVCVDLTRLLVHEGEGEGICGVAEGAVAA